MRVKSMNKRTNLYGSLLLLLILLSFSVSASVLDDARTSGYSGVDIRGTNAQGGQGNWESVNNLTVTNRSITSAVQSYPVIANIDQRDTDPEILIQNGDFITVYDILESTGAIIIITSQDVGDRTHPATSEVVTATPGWARYNTTHTHIVTLNATHTLDYFFNGTTLSLNSSAAINHSQGGVGNIYPKIACQMTGWADNDGHCTYQYFYRNGGTVNVTYIEYNLNDSSSSEFNSEVITGTAQNWHVGTPYIIDYDNTGAVNAVFLSDGGTGDTPADIVIYDCEIVNNAMSCTKIHDQANVAADHNHYTDLLIADVDGDLSNGYELAYGYSTDNLNNNIRLLASSGSVIEDFTFSEFLPARPTGDIMVRNLIDFSAFGTADGNLPCDTTRGVWTNTNNVIGMIVKNTTSNSTTLACVSTRIGTDARTVSWTDNTPINSDKKAKAAKITSDTNIDIAYAHSIYDSGSDTVTSTRTFSDAITITPIDYFGDGILDLLVMNDTNLWYYNDGTTNPNVVIQDFTSNTGDPVCTGTEPVYQVSVTDPSNDFHTCFIEIAFINGTTVTNTSNSTAFAPATHSFSYLFPTANRSYVLTATCHDQFNDGFVTSQHNVNVRNNNCFSFAEGGWSVADETPTTPSGVASDAAVESTLDTLTGASDRLKLIMGIGLILLIIGVMAVKVTQNATVLIISALLSTIMVTMLGFFSAWILILIIIGLVLILILSKFVLGGSGGE